ncbi:MAG: DegQ family serine endoprotease [Desulfobulbaceae bacterium]|nr:DegQ family serine endoprotease [Desulfobulbaceae bacterium]
MKRKCFGNNSVRLFLALWVLLMSGVTASQPAFGQTGAPASFADLAEQYGPTVVNIYSTQTIQSRNLPYEYFFNNEQVPEMFKRFFDLPQGPRQPQNMPSQKRTSLGSGVIASSDGYILTNNHVVENADEINVRLANAEEYRATIIGRDPKTDLALVKIDPKHALHAVTFGDSESLRVGDWVIAIGNPFGFEQTVTAGIVSGKGRTIGDGPYQNFIQTDASINPGNSGGPLFNLSGQLMGINTAIFSRSGGNIGLGFAIPANMVKSVFTQLKGTGKVTRGMIGVIIQPVTQDLARQFKLDRAIGALIGQVTPGGPAEQAGVKAGDIIIKYQGQLISQGNMLPALVAETPVGTTAKLILFRDGKEVPVEVLIGELPEERAAAGGGQANNSLEDDLGFTVQVLTPELAQSLGLDENSGLLVSDVRPGSLAADSGLQRGDLIVEAGTGGDRQVVASAKDLEEVLSNNKNQNILLLVKSNKQTRFVLLKRN